MTTTPHLYTPAEARTMRLFERFTAAVKLDMYMQHLAADLPDTFDALEQAALSRSYLTDDEYSCVGMIWEGRLLLWVDALEVGKRFEAVSYAINQEVIG